MEIKTQQSMKEAPYLNRTNSPPYTIEQKLLAVDYAMRHGSCKKGKEKLAKALNISTGTLYRWIGLSTTWRECKVGGVLDKSRKKTPTRPVFDRELLRRLISLRMAGCKPDEILEQAKVVQALPCIPTRELNRNFDLSRNWVRTWGYRHMRAFLRLSVDCLETGDEESPLVPPSHRIDRRGNDDDVFKKLSVLERQKITRSEQLRRGQTNPSRSYRSSRYSGEYVRSRILGKDPAKGETVNKMYHVDTATILHGFIDVNHKDGSKSCIDFHCGGSGIFSDEMEVLNNACRSLGEMWKGDLDKIETVRPSMIKIGVKTLCGSGRDGMPVTPALRRYGIGGLEKCKRANIAAKTVCEKMIPAVFSDINSHQTYPVPQSIGGQDGLCSIYFQSIDLENESHFDNNDLSACFVAFSSQSGVDVEGWYLLFPDVKLNRDGEEYHGLAIRLRNGIIISWDGRKVTHCSTRPDHNSGDALWGTCFVASKSA